MRADAVGFRLLSSSNTPAWGRWAWSCGAGTHQKDMEAVADESSTPFDLHAPRRSERCLFA